MKETLLPPVKARLRRLTAEEIELWLSVTKTVVRRPEANLPERPPAAEVARPQETAEASAPRPGSPPPAALPDLAKKAPPSPSLAPLERRLRQRLARGQAAPDGAIDLHGLSRQDAFVSLRTFLIRAQQDGAKLVLVVTGKGGGRQADGEPGILRKSVPQWLHGPDFRSLVVGFEEASRSHGGHGALYVRIRRHDKAGR